MRLQSGAFVRPQTILCSSQAEKKKAAVPKPVPAKQQMPKGGKQAKAQNKQGARGMKR